MSSISGPLLIQNRERIQAIREWEDSRRPEVLRLFQEHVYGRNAVEKPAAMRFEETEGASSAFNGQAERRKVRILMPGPGGEVVLNLTVFRPKATPPKACFVLIVNRSPEIIGEAETNTSDFWPVDELISRGYATAAFDYQDVALDDADSVFGNGVFKVFGPATRSEEDWGAIAAWAWGLSRAVDYLSSQVELANVPMVVVGHSRGGKAALWCGAQDKRVALTISNNSGCTGAALNKVMRGETIRGINTHFPHWFAERYRRYNDRPSDLPVDQDLLLASIAPRLVYVASASADAHADPAAEFQACVEAAPVFELYGKEGVGLPVPPAIDELRHAGAIGYHLREGKHGLTRKDWVYFMMFTEKALCSGSD